MYIGARILKTGLAVTLSILLCKYFQLEPAIYAAITAVINMQPSVNKSLTNAWEQVSVHVISVALAIIFGLLFGSNPWVMGLAVVIIIMICNRLKWTETIALGVISIIFILDSPTEQFLTHAGVRSITIFIGLTIALLVNRVLAPPRYKKKLSEQVAHLFHDTSDYFMHSIATFIASTSLLSYEARVPEKLLSQLEEATQTFEHARDEYSKGENVLLVERQLEICRGFIERGQNIENMTQQRVRRRQSQDAPLPTDGIRPEYQTLLDILAEGTNQLDQRIRKAAIGFKEVHRPEMITNDEEYWIRFDQAINDWQRKVSGIFYLQAMLEIAVIATEMRWAARRLKMLYNVSGQGVPVQKGSQEKS